MINGVQNVTSDTGKVIHTRAKWQKIKIMDLILWNIKIDFILTNKAFEGLC